jgi:hypothetical protein
LHRTFRRISPKTSSMQPLADLQQLVDLKFTCSEYGAAAELPAAAAAALRRLEVLDASDCAPLAAAGDPLEDGGLV